MHTVEQTRDRRTAAKVMDLRSEESLPTHQRLSLFSTHYLSGYFGYNIISPFLFVHFIQKDKHIRYGGEMYRYIIADPFGMNDTFRIEVSFAIY